VKILLLTIALIAVPFASFCQAPVDADLVVAGGPVHTMDASAPRAQAVAVRDGKIIYVGDEEGAKRFVGASTRWIDAAGGAILPGLVDAHGHLGNLGESLMILKLVGTRSRAEVVAMVRKAQENAQRDEWIRGRGWDQNDWDAQVFPSADDLAGMNANPLYLKRVDGHAVWVNRRALEIAGITADTPDPPGGRIIRDTQGNPTGVLIDQAKDLVSVHIPSPTDRQLDERIRVAIRQCNSVGLTGVHEAGTSARMLASMRRIAREGGLTLRVYTMLDSDSTDLMDAALDAGPVVQAGGYLTIRAFKVYADGALGSRGAALLAPYDDEPDNSGLMITEEDAMRAFAERAVASGFQMCVHAIGDRGNRVALDVYEAVTREHPGDHRFRIEHAQIVSVEDLARFAEIGVIPAMQPTHCTSDMYWVETRVGSERATGAYAWRTLLDDGNVLAFGSDFPVEHTDPLWGIYAAVTRQDHEGWPDGGWYPAQRITVEEAVRAFTYGAAYAAFEENERGTITVGKAADLTVLDRDIFGVDPPEILNTRAAYTIVGGAVVYERAQ